LSQERIPVSRSSNGLHRAITYIQDICFDYGLNGNIFSYMSPTIPESDLNKSYLIAGVDPSIRGKSLPESIDPEQVLRKINRTDKLFYPSIWVYDLSSDNDQLRATQELVEYCKKAEFVYQIYSSYNTPVPAVLRTSEVNQLMDAWAVIQHPNANSSVINKAKKDLDAFFKREQSKGQSEWMQFFRSDRFPDTGGKLAKLKAYSHRNEQVVEMDQLLEFNHDIQKLEMQEHEYKLFRDLMTKLHPDVTYAVGKKEVVDHGLTEIKDAETSPFGRSVTAEEYAVIRKERFAEEGWAALSDLKMAYWEFRDVYFKDIDAPLIASVYNKIRLEYAKSDHITELMAHGPMHLKQITIDDFMNFVSLAKANGLRFHIDNDGVYSIPSLDHVNVIFNESQIDILQGITARMLNEKISGSHSLDCKPLETRLADIHTSGHQALSSTSYTTPNR